MSVKSSTIKPTNIGSKGNVKDLGSSPGPQYSHLPSGESYANANVNRRSVSGGMPSGAQKNSPGSGYKQPGSGESSKPTGRQLPFLPSSSKVGK